MVEGAREAFVEGVQHRFEEFEFLGGGIDRFAHEDQASLAEMFREGEDVKDLERPLRVEGGTGDGALRVGERSDENEAVRGEDFTIDEFAPHFLAVGHAEAVEELAARAEVHVAEADGTAFWAPPVAEVIGVGPSGEDEFAGGVEHTGDGEAVVTRAKVGWIGGWVGGGHGVFIAGAGWLCPEVLKFKGLNTIGSDLGIGEDWAVVESKIPTLKHRGWGTLKSPVMDGWHPSSRNEESGKCRVHKTEVADLFL